MIDIRTLSELMPMHLMVDRAGVMVSRGKTLAKVLGSASRLEDAFIPANNLGHRIRFEELFPQLGCGRRVFLQLRDHGGVSLRGHGVHLSPDMAMLNLGFGIYLSSAVQKFELNDSDFPPSDLAMEFLFLHEANRAALLELSRVNTSLEGARESAQILSITDPLTGLLNRRGFDVVFSKAFEARNRNPFALVHLDLDHFKEVNDRFGHAAGDRVLVTVASVLASGVRSGDRVCRIGGDEFLILIFSDRPEEDAMNVCTRMIHQIMAAKTYPCRITASMGVAVSGNRRITHQHQLFEMADAALYQAKLAGKGRVVLWTDPGG
ncbi:MULTISPECIES: GGDEF domain-containing protein [Paracoccus]|uniref:diguanylate cyclase n=2 Tax=Paracoccus versutus TaxID=34007 RepID=A0A3D9XUM5_PARVE|nr:MULTISPECIES: GGDEF domain-containing protein [Paracoccus]KGJ09930.1 diguanylate cyclase [Paracoccus versutus]REF71912.1 diguanylate cyclase (GGDEF)-like protein [Paracoccus versutus]